MSEKRKLLRLFQDSPSQALELADVLGVDLGVPELELVRSIIEKRGDPEPFGLLMEFTIALSNAKKSQLPTVRLMEMLDINPFTQRGKGSGQSFLEGRYFEAIREKESSGWVSVEKGNRDAPLKHDLKVGEDRYIRAIFFPPEAPYITAIPSRKGIDVLFDVTVGEYKDKNSLHFNDQPQPKWTGDFKQDLRLHHKTLKNAERHLEGLKAYLLKSL